ncbi:hypothetical protein Scel_60450 [Streptomyces cellostaticus]|nr:hypothetical protein Scel_60450 [Streptomyces cellostaticus]
MALAGEATRIGRAPAATTTPAAATMRFTLWKVIRSPPVLHSQTFERTSDLVGLI